MEQMTIKRAIAATIMAAALCTLPHQALASNNCGANWFEQAAKQASKYQELFSFNKSQLIGQLIHDGFTQEQDGCGAASIGL